MDGESSSQRDHWLHWKVSFRKRLSPRGSHIVEFVTQRTFSNAASGEKFAIADSTVSLEIRFIW